MLQVMDKAALWSELVVQVSKRAVHEMSLCWIVECPSVVMSISDANVSGQKWKPVWDRINNQEVTTKKMW